MPTPGVLGGCAACARLAPPLCRCSHAAGTQGDARCGFGSAGEGEGHGGGGCAPPWEGPRLGVYGRRERKMCRGIGDGKCVGAMRDGKCVGRCGTENVYGDCRAGDGRERHGDRCRVLGVTADVQRAQIHPPHHYFTQMLGECDRAHLLRQGPARRTGIGVTRHAEKRYVRRSRVSWRRLRAQLPDL